MDWQDIANAPDDFERPGGQRVITVRDRNDRLYQARRSYFNNSGWIEDRTNREIWPVWWDAASLATDQTAQQ